MDQALKTCLGCGEAKPLDEFYRHKRGALGRCAICKVCDSARHARYAAANRTRVAAIQRRYVAQHPEQSRATNQKWVDAHPEYERNRYAQRKADPDAYRKLLDGNMRRARLQRERGQGLSAQDLAVLMSKPCVYCNGKACEIDHVIPLSKGGTHTPGNMVPACRSCNARKSNRTPQEWVNAEHVKALLEHPGLVL